MSERPLNVLLFGGCLLHQPLRSWAPAKERISLSRYRMLAQLHTFGEMLQYIRLFRGEKDIPQEYRALCRMSPYAGPIAGAHDFADIDVVLVEPSSPIEIVFRGVNINRGAIYRLILKPIFDLGKEQGKAALTWFRLGLLELNEPMRAQAAEQLIGYVPDADLPDVDLARDVIREARAEKWNVRCGFEALQEMIGRPIPMGVVIYVFRYMPDGREISWPANFREDVIAAARHLHLPVFEPAHLVRTFGVAEALLADFGHYTEPFLPTIASALLDFADSVAGTRDEPSQYCAAS